MAFVFWASDPLIDEFYKNLSIEGSEAQNQRPHELLWMLWFDEKSISNLDRSIKQPPWNGCQVFHAMHLLFQFERLKLIIVTFVD